LKESLAGQEGEEGITLFGELSLEEAMDLSQDRLLLELELLGSTILKQSLSALQHMPIFYITCLNLVTPSVIKFRCVP
jgi:hypothetical protein